jgi:hypothetical protein
MTGCDPACSPNDYASFETILDYPADGEVINTLTPLMSWHHNESCIPHEFTIYYQENGFQMHEDDTSGENTSSPLEETLLPGREYKWTAFARHLAAIGVIPDWNTFYTGPVCSGQSLVAPVLKEPLGNGWISHNHQQKFEWFYPGDCLPTSYTYQFASDPAFSNLLTSGTTPLYQQHLYETFPSCSTVFWRVAARDGTTIGPWSAVGDFHWVRWFDDCAQTHYLSINTAEIKGRVFHDVCPQTSSSVPLGQTLSVSCTTTSGFGVHGNGNRDLYDLPLIVTINLGSGPCPSVGLDSQTADGFGRYQFVVQTPGVYCLSITKQQSGIEGLTYNPVNLNLGLWTHPLTKESTVEYTLNFSDGYTSIVENFGWDQYELPRLTVSQLSFCRLWPTINHRDLAILNPEEIFPVIAQNEAGTWVKILVGEIECFTSLGNGELDNPDLLKFVPIIKDTSIPEPEPSPVPESDLCIKPCSGYTEESLCIKCGCSWKPYASGQGGTCHDKP